MSSISQQTIEKLINVGCPILLNEPLCKHTSFRIGGKATVVISPEKSEDIVSIIQICKLENVFFKVIGNGSNILAPDEGIDIVIISIVSTMSKIITNGKKITAKAGTTLSSLCNEAKRESLTGIEFAFGIPGTVGGAVVMNAGAYGGEMKDIIHSVTALSLEGEERTFTATECEFSYRHSLFSQGGWIITSAVFLLKEGDSETIGKTMSNTLKKRVDKQPLEYPSAGSTFKRPADGFASQLIDECGLKGRSVGGAQVSEKHAGFIINTGGATKKDILELCEIIKSTVKEKKSVSLTLEIEML